MGVLQGCVLSPLLFNIFLEMIVAMALDGVNEGADIGGEKIGDMRFADDIALLADVHGVRNRGRPKKRWTDMIKEDCKELNMTLQEATHMMRDRIVLRATCIDERLTRATSSPGP